MCIIKISEKTLKFNDVEVYKNKCYASKERITLNSELINKIVVFEKFEHSDKDFLFFIGYKEDNIIRPLCIILPQMSEYIKYFNHGGKKYVLQNWRW